MKTLREQPGLETRTWRIEPALESDETLALKVALQERQLAELEEEFGRDVPPAIGLEEARDYLEHPYRHYPPEKLHALYEECGHVREVADYLGSHKACRPETALGLYRLHGRDEEYARRLIRSQPALSAELAQMIFDDHLREDAAREDFPLQTRQKMGSLRAETTTAWQIADAAQSALGKRNWTALRAQPEDLSLIRIARARTAAVTLGRYSLREDGCPGAGYRIAYATEGIPKNSRQIFLRLFGGRRSQNLIFFGHDRFGDNGYRGMLLEPEARSLLSDLERLAAAA